MSQRTVGAQQVRRRNFVRKTPQRGLRVAVLVRLSVLVFCSALRCRVRNHWSQRDLSKPTNPYLNLNKALLIHPNARPRNGLPDVPRVSRNRREACAAVGADARDANHVTRPGRGFGLRAVPAKFQHHGSRPVGEHTRAVRPHNKRPRQTGRPRGARFV